MDGNRNWNEIGSELRDAVEHSVRTGDFSGFAGAVTDTMGSVLDEARRQAGQYMYSSKSTTVHRNGKTVYDKRQEWESRAGANMPGGGGSKPHEPWDNSSPRYGGSEPWNRADDRRTQPLPSRPAGRGMQTAQLRRGLQQPKPLFRRKGDVAAVLWTVFGGIGTALTGIALLVFGIVALVLLHPVVTIVGLILIGGLMGGSIAMIAKGVGGRKRLARAERYLALCQNHDYINLSDLAAQTGQSESFVRRDVKKMMSIGLFPQGHLDRQESCLILSDETFREYLALEKQRANLELEQSAGRQSTLAAETAAGQASRAADAGDSTAEEKRIWRSLSGIEDAGEELQRENPVLAAMIAQGQECTGHIRQMNENIPGEVISNKLYELERVLKEIFNRVREHPDQVAKMKKFMDYYLPTTLKLVEAYEEFDSVPNPGEEILQAKGELEKTLDTINASFAELLNQMYQTSVLDATTDAKVLQTMLAKDGLAKDHAFEVK